eukprot:SAG31_NODE_975_length_10623_cov_7.244964_3_plen_55_part_00
MTGVGRGPIDPCALITRVRAHATTPHHQLLVCNFILFYFIFYGYKSVHGGFPCA